MLQQKKNFPHSWEEAIDILRKDPQHRELIYDSYLTSDLRENCRRFADGARPHPSKVENAARIFDRPAGGQNEIVVGAVGRGDFEIGGRFGQRNFAGKLAAKYLAMVSNSASVALAPLLAI